MMRQTIQIVVAVLLVAGIASAEDIKTTPSPATMPTNIVPAITIDEAIAAAREFVKTNQIDVSGHYMSEVRRVLAPDPRHPEQGRDDWVVVWSNPHIFRDDIILFVGMDRKVIRWSRRGLQQQGGGYSPPAARSAQPIP